METVSFVLYRISYTAPKDFIIFLVSTEIVEHIAQNPTQFAPLLIEHLATIRLPGKWATQVEIQAASSFRAVWDPTLSIHIDTIHKTLPLPSLIQHPDSPGTSTLRSSFRCHNLQTKSNFSTAYWQECRSSRSTLFNNTTF